MTSLKQRENWIRSWNSHLNKDLSRVERYIRIVESRRDGLTWKQIGKAEKVSGSQAQHLFNSAIFRVARRLGIFRDIYDWDFNRLSISEKLALINKK